MRAIRCAFLAFSMVMAASSGGAQEGSPVDWKPLADFESVEAFEAQLEGARAECMANAGGSSWTATCFELRPLGSRAEPPVQAAARGTRRAGEGELTQSQRDWLEFRDSTFAFNRHVLDRTYSAPGTMWIGMEADKMARLMAPIVRDRTLMRLEWEKLWAVGPLTEEMLLNE